jgi:glycerate 2-kinase
MIGTVRFRGMLRILFRAALEAVEPEALVARAFGERRVPIPAVGRLGVFAAGKAAMAMARGVPEPWRRDVLIVAPEGSRVPRPWQSCTVLAPHPRPSRASCHAARRALAFFRSFGPQDLVLALVSGGTSSLLCLPRPEIGLARYRRLVEAAVSAGLPIERVNALRTSMSRIKGGRLAEATRARVMTLVLSDVPTADFRIVGSGPTVSLRKPRDRAIRLADNRTGLQAAAREAGRLGLCAKIERPVLAGEARVAGAGFARRLVRCASGTRQPIALLAGGETTVSEARRGGRGGRAQELALAAAIELDGIAGVALLSAGSDGRDGRSDNAGAFADGRTLREARRRGLRPEKYLARHDSAVFFEALGAQWRTGATGTNVADWVFGIANMP